MADKPKTVPTLFSYIHYIVFIISFGILGTGLIGSTFCLDPQALAASIYETTQGQLSEVSSLPVQGLTEGAKGFTKEAIDYVVINVCPSIIDYKDFFSGMIVYAGIAAAVSFFLIVLNPGKISILSITMMPKPKFHKYWSPGSKKQQAADNANPYYKEQETPPPSAPPPPPPSPPTQ